MVEMLRALEDNELNNIEYVFTVGTHSVGSSNFKLRIPKVMPFISGTSPIKGKESTGRTMLVNDSDTKPAMGTSVATQNYMTFPKLPNASFSNSSKIMDDTMFDRHLRGIMMFPDFNIRDGYLHELF